MTFPPKSIKDFLAHQISLPKGSASDAEIIETITRSVEFKGNIL